MARGHTYDGDERTGPGRRADDTAEPSIKVAHLRATFVGVILSIFLSAGGIIWSLAVFKTETVSSFEKVGTKVDDLGRKLELVSTTTQENRDWIMKRQGAEEEAAKRDNLPQPRRTAKPYTDDGLPKFQQ